MRGLHSTSAFAYFPPCDWHPARQVLLAAQEPPTLRLLAAAWNSMGLPLPPATGGAAKKVSCWRMRMDDAEAEVEERLQLLGSLYVVRDGGRVHVFHKSFHDFLLKPELAGGRVNAYRCNPLPVHTALAAVVVPLASAAAAKPLGLQPPPLPPGGNADADVDSSSSSSSLADYAVRYAARHLVTVGNDTMGDDPPLIAVARGVLSVLLADFDYVAAAFKDGHGHTLIRSVVELAEPRSPEVADAVRWLLNRQHELYTAKSVSEVVNTALRCPLRSLAMQRAQAWVRERAAVPAAAGGAGCCWLTRRVLGRTGQDWSACTLVIKVGDEAAALHKLCKQLSCQYLAYSVLVFIHQSFYTAHVHRNQWGRHIRKTLAFLARIGREVHTMVAHVTCCLRASSRTCSFQGCERGSLGAFARRVSARHAVRACINSTACRSRTLRWHGARTAALSPPWGTTAASTCGTQSAENELQRARQPSPWVDKHQ